MRDIMRALCAAYARACFEKRAGFPKPLGAAGLSINGHALQVRVKSSENIEERGIGHYKEGPVSEISM